MSRNNYFQEYLYSVLYIFNFAEEVFYNSWRNVEL